MWALSVPVTGHRPTRPKFRDRLEMLKILPRARSLIAGWSSESSAILQVILHALHLFVRQILHWSVDLLTNQGHENVLGIIFH